MLRARANGNARARTVGAWLLLVLVFALLTACGRGATAAPDASSPVGAQSGGAPAGQSGQSPAGQAGAGQSRSADAERIAQSATWAPGSLREHFEKHGREGPYDSAEAYDAAARETIRLGADFRYVDRSTNARRRGFYHAPTNRFTGVTDDGRRITTHFKPDSGERYVRSLPQSTYR
jgi:hypothetical protein